MFNEPGMTELTQSWSGTFGTDIAKKSEKLHVLASYSAGYDSGDLVASLDVLYGHTASGNLESRVGANPRGTVAGYGLINHEGAPPHQITPRRARALRFARRGVIVFAQRVSHPGSPATKFLTRWLRDVF